MMPLLGFGSGGGLGFWCTVLLSRFVVWFHEVVLMRGFLIIFDLVAVFH